MALEKIGNLGISISHNRKPLTKGRELVKIVNLDAMIPREDFEVAADGHPQSQRLGKEIKLSELEDKGIIYNILRKPDFQRETSSRLPKNPSGDSAERI